MDPGVVLAYGSEQAPSLIGRLEVKAYCTVCSTCTVLHQAECRHAEELMGSQGKETTNNW